MSTSYLEKLRRLENDEYQKTAFESQNNTVVLAGPGSGKTTVLTLKAMHLLNGVIAEPRGLACLTYSREAAREFTERLKELGVVRGKNIFLGTVHSFCLTEILGKFGDVYALKIPTPIKIISEKEKRITANLFEKAKHNVQCEDRYLKIEKMNCARMLSIAGVSNIGIEVDEKAEVIADEYEKLLFQTGCIDYETIIIESTKLLQEKPYVRECISAKYPWLLIDEYHNLLKEYQEINDRYEKLILDDSLISLQEECDVVKKQLEKTKREKEDSLMKKGSLENNLETFKEQLEQTQEEYQLLHEKIVQFEMEHVDVTQVADQQVVIYLKRFSKDFNGMKNDIEQQGNGYQRKANQIENQIVMKMKDYNGKTTGEYGYHYKP